MGIFCRSVSMCEVREAPRGKRKPGINTAAQRKSTESTEKRKERKVETLDRRSPPFANDAKDGAP
jgi:hypothetical protein